MRNTILNALILVLLICVIFFAGALFIGTIPFIVIQTIGLLFIFWALLAQWVHPKTGTRVPHKQEIFFFKEGPYEFVRHPVYTGVLLIATNYVQQSLTLFGSLTYLLLVAVLIFRIEYEERANLVHFKNHYTDYKKNTKKLIPYIY